MSADDMNLFGENPKESSEVLGTGKKIQPLEMYFCKLILATIRCSVYYINREGNRWVTQGWREWDRFKNALGLELAKWLYWCVHATYLSTSKYPKCETHRCHKNSKK